MRWILPLFFALMCPSAWGQNRPFETEPVETVPKDKVRLELGFEFLQDGVFRLSGLEGDLSRVGVLGLRIGAGDRVELMIDWTAQNFLNVDRRFEAPGSAALDFSGNSTSSVGDVTLGTKVRFRTEEPGSPGIGAFFAVKLPNASNESGLGTDETDFMGALLVEKRVSDLRVVANAGFAILGDPVEAGSQDDLFTYGVAALYSVHPNVNLLAELVGRAGPDGIGTEEQTHLRLGAQIHRGGVYWDFAFFAGFQDTDPDTGIIVGISKDFDWSLFK